MVVPWPAMATCVSSASQVLGIVISIIMVQVRRPSVNAKNLSSAVCALDHNEVEHVEGAAAGAA
jgi:hypothetical protein